MGSPFPPDNTDAALAVLGLNSSATWIEIQAAFRQQIRLCHPDLVGNSPEATERSGQLNKAYAALAQATQRGTQSLAPPAQAATASSQSTDLEPVITLSTPPGDVFLHLLEAAHLFGDVSYVSPQEGMVQVLVSPDQGERYQLLISLLPHVSPPQVSFALDSLSGNPAAPIAQVVAEFSELLES